MFRRENSAGPTRMPVLVEGDQTSARKVWRDKTRSYNSFDRMMIGTRRWSGSATISPRSCHAHQNGMNVVIPGCKGGPSNSSIRLDCCVQKGQGSAGHWPRCRVTAVSASPPPRCHVPPPPPSGTSAMPWRPYRSRPAPEVKRTMRAVSPADIPDRPTVIW